MQRSLIAQLEPQRIYGLRAEEFQVFLLVVVATVQRHVRGATPESPKLDRTPLGPEDAGAISRRRIAETLGIPLETVRRHVAKLVARGLVVERGQGRSDEALTVQFAAEGAHGYFCQPHRVMGMMGFALVGDFTGNLDAVRAAGEGLAPRPLKRRFDELLAEVEALATREGLG